MRIVVAVIYIFVRPGTQISMVSFFGIFQQEDELEVRLVSLTHKEAQVTIKIACSFLCRANDSIIYAAIDTGNNVVSLSGGT